MVDLSDITTLLFDLDNTLLLFDDQEFMQIYVKFIHQHFEKEEPDLFKFMELFLASTNKMTEKEPLELDNLTKFAVDFESRIGVSHSEIVNRFRYFYETDFEQVCRIMKAHPIAKSLLTLASKYFLLVAATNPLFPAIANEKRMSIGGLDIVNWFEITSADDYHFAKPHLEFYEELLNRIGKKPSECMIIGDDPINDMVAGKLGIKTFLVKSNVRAFASIIKTHPDYENQNFHTDFIGTLEDLYESLKQYTTYK
ncbi:MAG: HAD family hydrolase [Promethearchaeota archaeon]